MPDNYVVKINIKMLRALRIIDAAGGIDHLYLNGRMVWVPVGEIAPNKNVSRYTIDELVWAGCLSPVYGNGKRYVVSEHGKEKLENQKDER